MLSKKLVHTVDLRNPDHREMGEIECSETTETKVTYRNLVGYMSDYEEGNLSETETIHLFSYLLKSKLAYSLETHYRETAETLVNEGYLGPKGEIMVILD